MMSMTIDIFDKVSLAYIKMKTTMLCMGESSRGVYPRYVNAADSVFDDLFGLDKMASRIMEARTPNEVARTIERIDYTAFFQLIRMKSTLKKLAGLIALKDDIKNGKADKEDRKFYKNIIEAISKSYGIRTGATGKYQWLADGLSLRGEDSSFSSVFDEDGTYIPMNRWLDGDWDYDTPSWSRPFDSQEEDVDLFAAHMSNTNQKSQKAPSVDTEDRFEGAINRLSNLIVQMQENRAQPQPVQPTYSEPDNDIGQLARAINNISSEIRSVSDRVDRLTDATGDQFDELYRDINSMGRPSRIVEYDTPQEAPAPQKIQQQPQQSYPSNGNFVQTSIENAIYDNIDKATQG